MLHRVCWLLATSLALVAAVGCEQGPEVTDGALPPDAPAASPAATDATTPGGVDTSPAAGVALTEDEIANIEKLPPEDQKLALAQKICPVGEEPDGSPTHLGSMDVPQKVEVAGRTVFTCCEGCVDALKADPEKYLAKLPPPPDEGSN